MFEKRNFTKTILKRDNFVSYIFPENAKRFKKFPRYHSHYLTLGGLISVNFLVFYLLNSKNEKTKRFMENHFIWSNTDMEEGRYWTMLTCNFAHQEGVHFFSNMCFLFIFGKQMHKILGPSKFILLYLTGGIAGSIANSIHPAYKYPVRGELIYIYFFFS